MSKQHFKNLVILLRHCGIRTALTYDWNVYRGREPSEQVLTNENFTTKWRLSEQGIALVNNEYFFPNGRVPILDIFLSNYKSKQDIRYQPSPSNF